MDAVQEYRESKRPRLPLAGTGAAFAPPRDLLSINLNGVGRGGRGYERGSHGQPPSVAGRQETGFADRKGQGPTRLAHRTPQLAQPQESEGVALRTSSTSAPSRSWSERG